MKKVGQIRTVLLREQTTEMEIKVKKTPNH